MQTLTWQTEVRTNLMGLFACGVSLWVVACASPTPQTPLQVVENESSFEIHGHRGARGLAPENTLQGFEKALDLQVDVLELDLHLSKDDVPVVWHDPVISPKKCEPGTSGLGIGAQELAIRVMSSQTLAKLDCRKNPDVQRFPEQRASGASHGIVTLARLFAFVDAYVNDERKSAAQRSNAKTVRFNVELKRKAANPEFIGDGFNGTDPSILEKSTIAAIRGANLNSRVVIQSFDHRALWAVRKIDRSIPLAALTKDVPDFPALAKSGATIWSPRETLVTQASMRAATAAGLQVIPWTVNDPARMRELLDLGVHGLITDRPDLANEMR